MNSHFQLALQSTTALCLLSSWEWLNGEDLFTQVFPSPIWSPFGVWRRHSNLRAWHSRAESGWSTASQNMFIPFDSPWMISHVSLLTCCCYQLQIQGQKSNRMHIAHSNVFWSRIGTYGILLQTWTWFIVFQHWKPWSCGKVDPPLSWIFPRNEAPELCPPDFDHSALVEGTPWAMASPCFHWQIWNF